MSFGDPARVGTQATFATVGLRQRVTKGPGSRAARVAMAFKLISKSRDTPIHR